MERSVIRDAADAELLPRVALRSTRATNYEQTLGSVILQQPLDVIEFDLRPRGVAEAAAQFLEDAADALDIDLAGDLHRQIVGFVTAQRPPERVASARVPLLASHRLTRTIAVAVAIALPHRLLDALEALAHGIDGAPLRCAGTFGIAFAEPPVGIPHGGLRVTEPVAVLITLIG